LERQVGDDHEVGVLASVVDEWTARRFGPRLYDPTLARGGGDVLWSPDGDRRDVVRSWVDFEQLVVEVIDDPNGVRVGVDDCSSWADVDRLCQRGRARIDAPEQAAEGVGDPDRAGADGEVVEAAGAEVDALGDTVRASADPRDRRA
jgi:hypothetical protein